MLSANESKPYRIIQVGLGDFGRRWLRQVSNHPSWEYAAIATRNDATRAECGRIAGLPEETQFKTLGEACQSGVEADAVLITTPHFRHVEDITLALESGMHVLVEKPLAGSWAECVSIRDLASRSDRIVMVGENYRFGKGAVMARNLVAAGGIGTPEYAVMLYFVGHSFPSDDWRNEYDYPGLIENATHQFDLMRYVTGADGEEVYCAASASQRTPHWPYPNVSAHFQMTGGLQFTFSSSWSYAEFQTPWEGEWLLYGTQGALRWTRDRILIQRDGNSKTIDAPSTDTDHTLTATLQEFTSALVEGRSPATDIHDNIKTIAMVFAAIESSRQRTVVSVPEFIDGHVPAGVTGRKSPSPPDS